jgi:Na+-transporting methylmalonyl-CoA/oxaloacetate decarboxylase gamma subunit
MGTGMFLGMAVLWLLILVLVVLGISALVKYLFRSEGRG